MGFLRPTMLVCLEATASLRMAALSIALSPSSKAVANAASGDSHAIVRRTLVA
jgi:hypothetical protein